MRRKAVVHATSYGTNGETGNLYTTNLARCCCSVQSSMEKMPWVLSEIYRT